MYLTLLSGFSNYNNRTVRKYSTVSQYISAAEGYWHVVDNQGALLSVNFKMNDGVSTSQVINNELASDFSHEPDYLIAYDDNAMGFVLSRWFILEIRENRGGQKELILRRDLVADYYSDLRSADCFVERGLCGDEDPLILNNEGMLLNQIKKSETLLKDDLDSAWIVGYMDGKDRISLTVATAAPASYMTIQDVSDQTGISVSQLNALLSGSTLKTMQGYWSVLCDVMVERRGGSYPHQLIEGYISQDGTGRRHYDKFSSFNPPNAAFKTTRQSDVTTLDQAAARGWELMGDALVNSNTGSVLKNAFAQIVDMPTDFITEEQYNNLKNISVPIFDAQNNIYFTINVSRASVQNAYGPAYTTMRDVTALSNALTALASNANIDYILEDAQVRVIGKFGDLTVTKTTLDTATAKIQVGGSDAIGLQTRPYKMFAMPLDPIYLRKPGENNLVQWDQTEWTKKLASAILRDGNSEDDQVPSLGIYDVQLLPYCPLRNLIRHTTVGHIGYLEMVGAEGYEYDALIDQSDQTTVLAYLYYCDTDSGSFIIPKREDVDTSKKYDSNAKMLRLCSPNYQGSFDFNVAKNGGVDGYVVNFTYKPYTPYIRVAPQFSGLYGSEFGDQRGLICGGNFSMTQSTSAWKQYELNNKNYQNIFNREIQSLDIQQEIQLRDAKLGAVAGSLQLAAQGALAGSSLSKYTAGTGALAGAGLGIIGGQIDINDTTKLLQDQRAAMIDKFNYQLGNIKALPNTLTKLDAFDISSKIWPFVEEYGPTEEEKALFEEHIRLQSYTLMRIEKLESQMAEAPVNDVDSMHYVKGQLIRTNNEDLRIDKHVWDEIYAELSKGVYC